jgi:thiol-disulfide isomerase/thioredoxin
MMKTIIFLFLLFTLAYPIQAQELISLQDTLSMKKDEKKLYLAQVGKYFTPFSFKDYNGHEFSNRSLDGKVSIIFFWHSMCGGCLRSINHLNSVVERFGKSNLNYYALSVGDDKWLVNSTVNHLARKGLKGLDSVFNFLIIPSNKHNLIISNSPKTQKDVEEYYLKDTIDYSQNLTREFAKSLNISGTPSFFITDKKGIIRYVSIGKMEGNKQQEFESILQYLLYDEK